MMNTSQGLLFAISWFALRFGLPILLTGLLIWVLARLDSRWQKEAIRRRKKLVQEGVMPMVKCWVLNDCPPEKRQGCRGFQEKYLPCWQVFRDASGNVQERCLVCDVFRKAPVPVIDK